MYSTTLADEYGGDVDPQGTAGKAELVIENENRNALRDSGLICRFGVGRAVEGDRFEALLDADYDDLLAVGARIVELERHFRNQRGHDADEDRLPYDIPDLASSVEEYYELRGWNDDGTVPSGTVDEYAQAD